MHHNQIEKLNEPQSKKYRIIYLIWLTLAFCLPINSHALIIDVTQSVDAFWDYYPPNSYNLKSDNKNTTYNTLGQRTTQLNINGTKKSEVFFSTSLSNRNQIRSETKAEVEAMWGEDDSLSYLEINTTNKVDYRDQIFYHDSPDDVYVFKFASLITGKMGQSAELTSSQGDPSVADMLLSNRVNFGAGAIGQPTYQSDSRELKNERSGYNPSSIFELQDVNFLVFYADIIFKGSAPIDFGFTFSEEIDLYIEGIDAETLSMLGRNLFQSTVTTYASVYDSVGNLLPDARVSSIDGFTYDPLPNLQNPPTE